MNGGGSVAPTVAERERFADALRDGVGSGILSLEEFEARLDAVYAAQDIGELERLVKWLPPSGPARRLVRPRFLALAIGIALVFGAVLVWVASGLEGGGPAPIQTTGAPETGIVASPTAQGVPDKASVPDLRSRCTGPVPFEQTFTEYLNVRYLLLPAGAHDLADCARLAGVDIGPEGAHADYRFVFLEIHLGGGQIWVPEGIGIDPSLDRVAPLFTKSDTGIVYVAKDGTYTLGQLFQVWGHTLVGDKQIGVVRLRDRTLHVYVNGQRVLSEPASIVLKHHDDIRIFADNEQTVRGLPAPFEWPPGY